MASTTATTPVEQRTNRVHWLAGRVHEVLDDVVASGAPVATLDAGAAGEAVAELLRAAHRLQALALRVLAHADRVDTAAEVGHTSTAAWLAHTAVTPGGTAHRLTRLARRLEAGDFDAPADATQDGRLDVDRAEVIVDAVTALPSFVGPESRQR